MKVQCGLLFLVLFATGCQSKLLSHSQPPEIVANPEIENQFQQALQLLKEQEYQKAADAYLGIAQKYPQQRRAQEAGILGQELQRLVSLNQSLTTAKDAVLKDLKEKTEAAKRLSDQNARLEGVEKENIRLHSELNQTEGQLKGVTSLKEENRRLRSEVDQMKASLKELHELEQKMKQPTEEFVR